MHVWTARKQRGRRTHAEKHNEAPSCSSKTDLPQADAGVCGGVWRFVHKIEWSAVTPHATGDSHFKLHIATNPDASRWVAGRMLNKDARCNPTMGAHLFQSRFAGWLAG